MPPKKYRLETVLSIRRRAKEEAARQIAEKYEKLAQAEAELNRRQLALQACYERQNKAQTTMLADLNKVSPAKNLAAHKNYLRDLRTLEDELKTAVEDQKKAVARAEAEVEAAREKLVEAARQLKAIEVHKMNWQTTECIVQTRREQKISDEIGAILHNRREKS